MNCGNLPVKSIKKRSEKRKITFTACVLFIAGPLLLTAFMILPGCMQAGSNEKPGVVCTTFPQYDWVLRILGDKAAGFDLTLLSDSKIDLHNYQPSVDDIVKIYVCDLFIYVGGESDEWVDGALREATNKNMTVINLLDTLGDAAKEEEIIEGAEDTDHDGEIEYDEHVWLSLNNARIFCDVIADAISFLDADNTDVYQKNKTAYVELLSALDAEYRKTADSSPGKTLLFGDRFPFRYLADDYGLKYYAAFSGCSAETEASFATIAFLAQKTDELQLSYVMVTESSDRSVARTVIQNTEAQNCTILVLDSMQSVSSVDLQNGVTYLSVMENNLEVLKEALK
ncbi:MAG: metal ABC transporter substrate-binding protein [Oscillospiraceae bacterium]|nr:metal ABC transporter substrate-binding protein [Oscillospiraceae bacterium]